MIKSKRALQKSKLKINLTGPDGNAFVLLIFTRTLGKLLGKDSAKIIAEMTAGDYEHIITVFEREFGDFVTLYR